MELLKRTLSGLIYIGLLMGSFLCPDRTLLLAVFGALAFMGIWEYSALVGVNRTRQLRTTLDGLAAVALVASSPILSGGGAPYLMTAYSLYIGYVMVRSLYSERERMPQELALTLMGQLYVALPLSLGIGLLPDVLPVSYWGGDGYGAEGVSPWVGGGLLALTFVAIWANDTGAFLFGSLLGRRRLFPSLSPKKSWEGFVGGAVVATVVVVLLAPVLGVDHDFPLLVAMGPVVSVASTWGDLFESLLKRRAGVKDSGWVIPGHGGVLDRIDSALFALPAVYILAMLVW